MKHISFLFTFLLLFPTLSFSQVDQQKLKSELSKYAAVKSTNNFNAYTIHYLNKDSLIIYKIPYNKNGEIEADYFGLAYYFYQYDTLGRCIQSNYFDIYGSRHEYSEVASIIRMNYDTNNKMTGVSFHTKKDGKEVTTAIWTFKYDTSGKVIEHRSLNADSTIYERTRYEYRENDKAVLKKTYNERNNLIEKKDGVAIYYTLYTDNKRNRIIERKFLNRSGIAIPSFDNDINKEYTKEVYTYGLKKNYIKIQLYNVNKLIEEAWMAEFIDDEFQFLHILELVQ